MEDRKDGREPKAALERSINIKDDAYYANCTMVETTPFDVSVLLGRVRPKVDEKGKRTLVEVYEKHFYLSHLQARALHEALTRSLSSLGPQAKTDPPKAPEKGPLAGKPSKASRQ